MFYMAIDTPTMILACMIVFLTSFVIAAACVMLFSLKNRSKRKKHRLPPNPEEIDVRKLDPTKEYQDPFSKPL